MKYPIDNSISINLDNYYRYYLCQKNKENVWDCQKVKYDDSYFTSKQSNDKKIISIFNIYPEYFDKYKLSFQLNKKN